MAFRTNSSQQYSFTDKVFNLTPREQKALEKSWAKVFAEEIFPSIDEERFRVLYSERTQCRSNTPVNVIVGALIIKEMFQLSDDEVVENLMLDPRYQYALHTTSFDEQPLSDKSLSRFRKRCYDYETLHNVDLLHDCVTDLSKKIAKMMGITPRIRRMDSMMIEANIRDLSRAELLYTCVAKLVIYLHKNSRDDLITGLEHYYDPKDYNQRFYYSNSEETDAQIKTILEDADKLLTKCGQDFDDVTEYQLLVRCLSEQTVVENSARRLREKAEGMNSSMLQNPSDPDATFRTKAGKDHVGYVANVDESVSGSGSVVTDYQLEQNTYSDSQFLKDSVSRSETAEEPVTIVADGAYYGETNQDLASQKNITLVTTAVTGREVPDIYADFKLNEAGTRVLECPAGHTPKSCSVGGNNHLYVSFPRDVCLNCPHKEDCHVKVHKKVCSLTISGKAQNRARAKRMQGTERFSLLSRIRNGVETVPSILRRIYNADRMQVRGLIKTRFYFGCKIAALNIGKLITYKKGLGHYAQNPLLA